MRINVFYLISSLLTLLLVAALWLLFVPRFWETEAYELVKNVALIISALLAIVAAIQIFLAQRREDVRLRRKDVLNPPRESSKNIEEGR